MNEELLIGLVREYPELFDPFDKKYHDELRRNTIWCKIGNIMKENPDTCRARWKRLRDNFRRAKHLRKTKISIGVTKLNKPVKYEAELAFLNPFIGDEDEKSTRALPIRDDDGEQSLSPPSTPGSHEGIRHSFSHASKRKKTGNAATPLRDLLLSYIDKNEHNPELTVVDFFTNLGRTVHTFPEDVQIKVKSAVFNIVNNAENEVLQRKLAESAAAQRLDSSQASYSVMLLPAAPSVQPFINASSSSTQPNEHYYPDNSRIELLVPKTENVDETCEADSNIDE